MLNIKRIISFSLILLFGLQVHSQDEIVVDTSKNILLLKEYSLGIMLHTQGWGLKYNRGYNKTAFKKRMLTIEFVEMQSPKQIRTINPYFTNSKSYVYGKLNSVYMLRGSYGMHKLLNRKPYWGGVELRFIYAGGISLGFAKPVYLYILVPPDDPNQFYEYTIIEEKYNPDEHFLDNIYGRASFTKGFDEIKFYPGIHAKVGLDFDYGVYRSKVKSLEIGVMLDVYPWPIPIMAYNDPNYYFLTFYLNFNFGKRYN
jgi:hypothetical protein